MKKSINVKVVRLMKYTFECCNCCNKAEMCKKPFQKMVKCLQEYNKYCKEQEDEYIKSVLESPELYFCDDTARFILEEYDDDGECREIFDRYRCKGCYRYDDCFYAECASETYWEDQQHPVRECTYVATETKEIISNGDIPF